jgi:hypothetical protein
MLAAFKLLSPVWRLVAVLGLVASIGGGLWGVYAFIRHQGYVDGEAEATARCEDEKRAQREANDQAIKDAARVVDRLAVDLERKNMELNDAREARDAAAVADPLGSNRCLGVDSVRRLNAQH